MIEDELNMLVAVLEGGFLAFGLSLVLTPIIRSLAHRWGFVAHPRMDRWHRQPTALLGGIAIFIAFFIPYVLLGEFDRSMFFLLSGATMMFGLGMADDIFRLQPYTKLIVQIGAASLTTWGSFIPSDGLSLLLIPMTIFGLVAITNAFNLLDNMDGLSAGTACIASFFLFIISFSHQSWGGMLCGMLLFGTTLGFLVYNFNPATIFMGDSGSMFLGFLVGALTMKGNWDQATNLLLMVLTPLLVLAVPIFDTTFVTLVRWMNGRAISVGGRDHTSHRLVAFGLSERQAVLLFYLISIACGFIAYLGVRYNALLLSILGTLVVIGIAYFGMFLHGVVVYGTEGEVTKRAADSGVVLDIFLMHKRRILEVVVDMVLIALAYIVSFAVRFDGEIPDDHFAVLAKSLPIVISMKLLVLSAFGLYRGVWRYVGMRDLIAVIKAVTVSTLLVVTVMTMLFRFESFPRSVFVIDWMVLLLFVAGTRVLIRVIREYLFSLSEAKGKRIMIVGAGDAGELILREMRNNSRLGCVPVGFIDDDAYKHGRKIHGVPVMGGRQRIPEAVERLEVDQIMVAIPSARSESLAEIIGICEGTGLPVTVVPSWAEVLQGGVQEARLSQKVWKPTRPIAQ